MNNDIEKIIQELAWKSEYINDTLWYVNPANIRQALHQAQQSERDAILALRPEYVTGSLLTYTDEAHNRALERWEDRIKARNTPKQ